MIDPALRHDLRELLRIVLIALVMVALLALFAESIDASEPEPSLIVQNELDAQARTPEGEWITLPAGSQIGACASSGIVAEYRLATRSFHVLRPCETFFRDGFGG
jgi:hypothetical protein